MSQDPVLKKIFNRFYPKSQTASEGKKLYILAWALEILVVITGLAIAWIMMITTSDSDTAEIGPFELQIGLTFLIAAFAELTKIPLATAFYYAVRFNWKLLFLTALILINVLTFETIINGLQRNFTQQTKHIKAKQYELASVVNEMVNADVIIKTKTDAIQKDIVRINSNLKAVTAREVENTNSRETERAGLIAVSAESTAIKNLETQKRTREDEKKELNKQIAELNRTPCEATFINRGSCDIQSESTKKLEARINTINDEINDIEDDLFELNQKADLKNAGGIESIKIKYDAQLEAIKDEKRQLTDQLITKNEEIKALNSNAVERAKKTDELQKQKDILISEINGLAIENQFYNWAMLLKGEIEEKKPGKNTSEDKKLTSSKSKTADDKNSTNQTKTDTSYDQTTEALLSHSKKQYHLLSEDDLQFAFWLLFGVIGLVISLAGTLVGLAGIHMMDPRMQEERIRQSKIGPIAKFFRSFRYLLLTGRKRLMEPKIVEIEKQVEVEKEVIKEIPVDKIIYRDVPVEVTRRELVHVPLYTNDKELLGSTDDKDMSEEELEAILKEIRLKKKQKKDES